MNRVFTDVRRSAVLAVLALLMFSAGCETAGQGAVSGGAVGALSGLAIGSLTGSAGKGAAIGAVVGGVGGAVVGDQNRRKNEEAQRQAQSQQQAQSQTVVTVPAGQSTNVIVKPDYQTGEALGSFVGTWRVEGTIEGGPNGPLTVSGSARGQVDKTYFVRLDCSFTDPRTNEAVQGSCVISQTGNRGVEMTNAFSSSPEVKRFRGEMDASGTVFNLAAIAPAPASRKLIIRIISHSQWQADAWDGAKRTESLTFMRIGP